MIIVYEYYIIKINNYNIKNDILEQQMIKINSI